MTVARALALVPAFALALPLVAFQEEDGEAPRATVQQLKERDHEKLAEVITEYFEAVREEEGISDAREDLEKAISTVERKLDDASLLAHTADLEAVFQLTQNPGGSPSKGKVVDEKFEGVWDDEIAYALHAPKGYSSRGGTAAALVLSIPDAGQGLEEHLRDDWAGAVRDGAIVVACGMPEATTDWTSLGEPGHSGGVANVLQILREVRDAYWVDVDRVLLAGRGAGVAAAVEIAAQYPHVFAGVVGRSGDVSGTPAENFANLPTFFAGAGEGATTFEGRVGELGYDNCTLAAEADEAACWTWMSERKRVASPARVTLMPRTTAGGSAYWVDAQGFDPELGSVVTVTADRATNTVTVEGREISSVRLNFNDRLVDLDQPVRVVVNGVESVDSLGRGLQFLLDRAYANDDSGRVAVAAKVYDLAVADE